MKIDHLDHVVLTVQDIKATCAFYQKVFGMESVHFGPDRTALQFGQQKLNLHEVGKEFEPKALRPTPGSADLCFLTSIPLEQVIAHLQACEVPLVEGPVNKTGATGPLRSLYVRDPDGNLLEIGNVLKESQQEQKKTRRMRRGI
jgi:catechol 2,3-dioxygenase-like lactoylglutathione lyase family enzyme